MQQARRTVGFVWPLLAVGCSGFEPREFAGPVPQHDAAGIAGFSYDAGAPEGGKASASAPLRMPTDDWGPESSGGESGAPSNPEVAPPHHAELPDGGAAGEGGDGGADGAGRASGGFGRGGAAAAGAGGRPGGGGNAGHAGASGAISGRGGVASGGEATGEAGVAGRPAAGRRALLFSEYVEGSSSYKALEVRAVEPTPLDGCQLGIYSNGSTEGKSTRLEGELRAGETYVLCTSSLADVLGATCSLVVKSLSFNGNDAVTLECDGAVVDAIGQVGFDPKAAWSAGEVSTVNQTLRRRCSVAQGDAVAADAFDPSVEWTSHPLDEFSGLGSPGCD
jgi:hypothetical protein